MNALQKSVIITVFAIGILLIGFTYILKVQNIQILEKTQGDSQRVSYLVQSPPAVRVDVSETSPVHFDQRNDLSRRLNEMKKLYGQQSCDVKTMQKKLGQAVDDRISENGGWCAQSSSADSPHHRFDQPFAKALSTFFKGKTVGSFGDGPGAYKKALDQMKEVISYTAYDGAPYCEKTTSGSVKFLDLSAPQFGIPTFDWIVSVEVGEHIPAKYEDVFLDNLVRHAKEGVVLSWAVPGQGGLSHVNNQPLAHVMAQLEKRGFRIDKEAGKPLRESSSLGWLRANVHVYRRIDPNSFEPHNA